MPQAQAVQAEDPPADRACVSAEESGEVMFWGLLALCLVLFGMVFKIDTLAIRIDEIEHRLDREK